MVGFPSPGAHGAGAFGGTYGAESALGVAAILGGVCVAALGERLRLRSLAWVLGGIALLCPAGPCSDACQRLGPYAVQLLGMFFLLSWGQLVLTCAISLIRPAPQSASWAGDVLLCVYLSLCSLGKWCMGSSLTSSPKRCTGCCCQRGGLALWAVGMGPTISSKPGKT